MPRTKRPKKGRKAKTNTSENVELDPDIVIKQEPEDSQSEIMKFETEADSNSEEADLPLFQTAPDDQTVTVYSISQLRKLGDDMLKKQRKFFDKKKEDATSAIHVIKMKIPAKLRTVPIGDIIHKQELKLSDCSNLLSISQQAGYDDSTAPSVTQTNKIINNVLQEQCTNDTENEVPLTSSKFKTPTVGLPTPRIWTITPKVGPDSPITILRRPKTGEMVVSMKGSPVMSNAAREDRPTLNIPMNNGTVVSILPQKGLQANKLPQQMDPEIQEKLKLIRDNLKELIVQTETPKP